ncbi:hypothetical protein [Wenzhouxiangella marina]|uniref:Uncharacterized protein n=1 Tax=Wenzhouxiangella marina TaxID=1579979 RepID=A0A0K0XS00_9GAMM|nr:hypothetical protein [Wenzhouxiangella marina]AKS40489.1 hypothetical protein WM2015_98 [Wenzhouxiangella marina]MBB6088189.1 hypothetical protein [Wenzhouxiangella marina]
MIERYFTELDPPEGGLERLRRRLEKGEHSWRQGGRRLVPVAIVASVAALITLAVALRPATEEGRLHTELEHVFLTARVADVSIDDRPLIAHRSRDGMLEIYLGKEESDSR